jgi:hypothetical protein
MPSCRDPSEPAFNFGKDGRRILEAEPADASGLARTSVGATPEVSGHRARQRTPLDDPDQTTDLVRALDRRRKLSAPEATTARHRAWAGTVPKRVPEPADVPGRQRTLSEYLCWSGRGYGQPSTCVDDSPSSLNPRVRGSSPWRRTRMQVCDLRELTGLEPVFFVGDRCGRQVGVAPQRGAGGSFRPSAGQAATASRPPRDAPAETRPGHAAIRHRCDRGRPAQPDRTGGRPAPPTIRVWTTLDLQRSTWLTTLPWTARSGIQVGPHNPARRGRADKRGATPPPEPRWTVASPRSSTPAATWTGGRAAPAAGRSTIASGCSTSTSRTAR